MGQRVIRKGKSIMGYCLLLCPKEKPERYRYAMMSSLGEGSHSQNVSPLRHQEKRPVSRDYFYHVHG